MGGNVNVNGNGTVAFYGKSTDATFYLAASGAKVLANADIAKQITSAASLKTPSSLSYTSIADKKETNFTNGWEYYQPASGGGSVTPAITVKVESTTNGSFTVSDNHAQPGTTVTVAPKADEGYEVDAVTVTDKNGASIEVTANGDGTYSFIMPAQALHPVTVAVTFKETEPEPVTPDTVCVHRLFNVVSGEHLYTTHQLEIDALVVPGGEWIEEGIAWDSPKEGIEVYRLFNVKTGEHLYTTEGNERETLVAGGDWVVDFEGAPVFHAASPDDKTIAVTRLFNISQPPKGSHLWTVDKGEADVLETDWGWTNEGVMFHVFEHIAPTL